MLPTLLILPYCYVAWLGLYWWVAWRVDGSAATEQAVPDRFDWFQTIVDRSYGPSWREPARVLVSLATAVLLVDLFRLSTIDLLAQLVGDPKTAAVIWWVPIDFALLFIASPWLVLVYVDIVLAVLRPRRGPTT